MNIVIRRCFIQQTSRKLLVGKHCLHSRNISVASIYFNENQNNEEREDEYANNPYYEKYADKIKVAKQSGLYVAKKDMQDQLKKETEEWKRKIQLAEKSLLNKEKKKSDSSGTKLPKELNDLVHLDLFENKTSTEIKSIWAEYFKKQECISAVIPADIYDQMKAQSQEYPMFLYPLPKDQGYEFILSQFDDTRCFFTSLINYQVHEMNAPWQLCLTYYTEFKEDKGIVLMASELDTNAMNVLEAQCLAHLKQMFYSTDCDERLSLVKTFNHTPELFKYMDLVKLVESSNMVVKPTS